MSYNPDAKSELDSLDGLTPRNSNSGRVNRIELANIVREVSMESQSMNLGPLTKLGIILTKSSENFGGLQLGRNLKT